MLNNIQGMTQQTAELLKAALGTRYQVEGRDLNKWNALEKAVVGTAGNIVGYDLQAPARLMLPVITPIRNKLPRKSRAANPGTQSNWKVIDGTKGFTEQGYNNMGWVNEGARAGQFTYAATDGSAKYQTIGTEDGLTFEAESAAQGFEDANSLATFLLLQQMMIKEEMALLAGNFTLTLGTPTTPTVSASGSGTTLTNTLYSVIVVALTTEGYNNSAVSAGVAVSKTFTGPDGKQATVNGGSSMKSAAATITPTAGQQINASTPVINGAVAYAWYWGASGSELLGAITTINSVVITAAAGGSQNASAITVDHSKNNGTLGGGTNQVSAFDGLMTTAFVQGALGNAYVRALATGTPGTGTKLTSTGKGTVTEIDALLLYLWQTWRISPTAMFVNAQQQNDLTTLCLNTSSAPLLRINTDTSGVGELSAGAVLRYYTNYYTMDPAGVKIPVLLHPNVPPGTIFFHCERLPAHYVSNETPQVAEVLTRRDYYRIDWPVQTRERQYGVYSEETLAVYAPFGFSILTNIAPN